jgi:hypothetical protein
MMKGLGYKKKKGSSSIMVILIMLVLVIFGVLALMSSYSDLKLSMKNAAWLEKYYNLDAKGETLVSQIDFGLAKASKEALIGNTMDKEKYMNLAENEVSALKTVDRLEITKGKNILIISSKLKDIDKNMLSISLEVNIPYTNSLKGPLKYYKIKRWEQLPRVFKYNTISFGLGGK